MVFFYTCLCGLEAQTESEQFLEYFLEGLNVFAILICCFFEVENVLCKPLKVLVDEFVSLLALIAESEKDCRYQKKGKDCRYPFFHLSMLFFDDGGLSSSVFLPGDFVRAAIQRLALSIRDGFNPICGNA